MNASPARPWTCPPELQSNREWLYLVLLPPASLVAGRMVLAVVDRAERHGKLVTHLKPQTSRLRIADMMRMRR